MMTPYFIFSKIPPTHFLSFSHPGIGRGWKCVEALIPTADQGVVPPWRKIEECFDICVLKYFWFLLLWTIVFCIFCYFSLLWIRDFTFSEFRLDYYNITEIVLRKIWMAANWKYEYIHICELYV